jgi:hypothetical protein
MEHASQAEVIATQGLRYYQRDVQESGKSRRLIKSTYCRFPSTREIGSTRTMIRNKMDYACLEI